MWLCLSTLDQSPIAKSTPIVKESFFLEWYLVIYPKHPSGITLKPYAFDHMTQPSIFSTAASPARTSALQDMEKAWQESEADFFSRSFAWPKKSSPNFYSLKTSRLLQVEEDFGSLKKLPKWGMIVDGVLYPLHPLDQTTYAKDFSYLPTPTAKASVDCPAERRRDSPSLNCILNLNNGSHSLKTNPRYLEWMMNYPLGWTELDLWVTQYVLDKRKKRSKY